jgi:hypothetical protein
MHDVTRWDGDRKTTFDQPKRIRCRNQRCHTKLPVPTDNHHHAFCSKYCFEQFYQWRCKVCEDRILKGKRRKSPDHCHSVRCRKDFRRHPEAFSYPYSQTVKQDQRSAHFTGAFLGLRPMAGWHWDETIVEHEHWLYAHGRVVAIVCGAEGDWKIRYPLTLPVQTATTLEAARKLAINVAFWTWPIGGIKPKPAPQEKPTEAEWREPADEKYVAEDEERLRTEPPDLSGNYAPPDSGEWIDWPPDGGAS